jgi:predicted ATPase
MWVERVKVEAGRFPHRGAYPFNIAALREDQELVFRSPVSFLVGENGSGKSTLLEAIARRAGLHFIPRMSRIPEYVKPNEEHLYYYLSLIWTDGSVPGSYFSAENFREFAEFLDDASAVDPGRLKYFGGTRITTQSHGEGILSFFRGRYRIRGLYFLDEPEAALSPASQLGLMQLLYSLRSDNLAQFIIATHSPILMALPGAQVFWLDEQGVRETTYQETPHYRMYRDFMADPRAFLT